MIQWGGGEIKNWTSKGTFFKLKMELLSLKIIIILRLSELNP